MEMPGQGFLNSGATASAKLAHDAWPKGGILHNKLRSRAVGKGDYPNYPPGQQKKRREKSRVFIKDFPNGNRSPSPGRAWCLGCGGLIIATGDGSTRSEGTRQKQAGKDPLPAGRSFVSQKREPSWLTALSRRERGVSLHLARRRSVASSRGM